jgi:hypothetical protein
VAPTEDKGLCAAFGRRALAFAALPLVLCVAAKTMGEPVRPEDLWWHLGMGRLIAEQHAIPKVDVFSFTRPGAPYFDQPWLGQILLWLGYRLGGLGALLDLDFVGMLVAEALVIASSLRRGARLVPALLIQFALTPVAARGWSLRPQALAVPVFAAFVYILTRWREDFVGSLRVAAPSGRHGLWLLPPLMVVWANLHGTFPLGIALVLLTICARAIDSRMNLGSVSWRSMGLTAFGCALAPLVNPRGPALFAYVVSLAGSPSVRIAREWQPIAPTDAEGAYIFAFLVVTALVAIWKRPRAGDFVLLVPFAVLELSAVRNGIWLSLVLGPLVSGWLARSPNRPCAERPWQVVVVAAASVGLLAVPWLKPRLAPNRFRALTLEERTPIAAVEMLAKDDHRPARLLHGMAFGSYLIWALPSQRVFVDPRLEFYPLAQWRDVEAIEQGENIDTILERYGGAGFLCTKQREMPLVGALKRRPEFELRYEDSNFAYFVRR